MTQIAFMRGRHVAAPLPRTLNWRPVLHQRIGAAWPCNPGGDFPQLWEAISASAPIVSSEAVDHDADRTLAEMVWCLVRHLRPRVVVETGVARGMTARVILEAFRRNADGHLWSVDLPPLDEPWRSLVGTAEPAATAGPLSTDPADRCVYPRQPPHSRESALRARDRLAVPPSGRCDRDRRRR
jgi:hypothetical protein